MRLIRVCFFESWPLSPDHERVNWSIFRAAMALQLHAAGKHRMQHRPQHCRLLLRILPLRQIGRGACGAHFCLPRRVYLAM